MPRRLELTLWTLMLLLAFQTVPLLRDLTSSPAHASDAGFSPGNGGPIVGGYDEQWEAVEFANFEYDPTYPGRGTGSTRRTVRGPEPVYFAEVSPTTQSVSVAHPIVTKWRVTGHMHGK